MPKRKLRAALDLPEFNVAVFAFLLNFAWEMLQIRFFHGMAEALHWDAVAVCTQATIGDAGIALAAFWVVAWFWGRGRSWPLRPTAAQVAVFTVFGILVTIAFELLATQVWDRWSYSAAMPVIPLLEVGLLPLLQWTILPPLVIWLVYRQLT